MFLLYLSSAIFVVAAAYGFGPLVALMQKKPAKMRSVWIHGGLAILAAALMIIGAVKTEGDIPFLAVVGMIITVMAGLMLFALRRADAPVPSWIALLHPLIGILSLISLFMFLFGSRT
jgi:uncharacterized membrane protein